MLKPRLEAQFVALLANESSRTLTADHAITRLRDYAITLKVIDRAHKASLISLTTKERANKILRPTLSARLGKIFGR